MLKTTNPFFYSSSIKSYSRKLSLLGFALGAMLSGSVVTAEESCDKAWSLGLQTDLYSAYMFRGQDIYNGASIQPAVSGAYDFGDLGETSGSVWSHLSADESLPASERFTEIDYTISHTLTFDPVSIGVGHIWYTYPDSDDDIENSAEYFAKVGLDVLLAPTFTYYRDYDQIKANFFNLGFSHSLQTAEYGDKLTFVPYVDTTFVSDADGLYEDDGLAYIATGVKANVALGQFALVPSVQYNFEIDEATDNKLSLGVSLAYEL